MQRFYKGTVKPEHIDQLGHMSVPFYGLAAASAADALVGELGLGSNVLAGMSAGLWAADSYTRFYLEQVEGARLAIHGGILAAENTAVRIYLEMINDESGEIAATFRQVIGLVDLSSRRSLGFPHDLIAEAKERVVELPEHGRPRSLQWGPMRTDVTLEVLQERGVAAFRTYVLEKDDCDEFGFLRLPSSHGLASVGPLHARMRRSRGAGLHEQPSGRHMGQAAAEIRYVVLTPPRVGDTIRTYSAEVRLERKTDQWGQWTFDAKTGALLGVCNRVNIAFDLATRRSMEIPPDIREHLEANYHPDLG